MKYIIYSDGGARGNPGPAAFGFVIYSDLGFKKLTEQGACLGELTNNQAEYWGVIRAFEWFQKHKSALPVIPTSIEVRLDSNLLVNQLAGTFKIKSPGLRQLVIQAKGLEKNIGIPIVYIHVPREHNKDADRLVNQALDQKI